MDAPMKPVVMEAVPAKNAKPAPESQPTRVEPMSVNLRGGGDGEEVAEGCCACCACCAGLACFECCKVCC